MTTTRRKTVLVMENEPGMRRLLRRILSGNYNTHLEYEGISIAQVMKEYRPDLVVVNDPEVCKRLRQLTDTVRILLLTTREDAQCITCAFDADDCMHTPFDSDELKARVRALLERQAPSDKQLPDRIASEDGYLCLDSRQHIVHVGTQQIDLTPIEFKLLTHLMLHAGILQTHRTLLRAAWGSEYSEERDYLRVYIWHLRQKIEPDPARPVYILTISGEGYTFQSSGNKEA